MKHAFRCLAFPTLIEMLRHRSFYFYAAKHQTGHLVCKEPWRQARKLRKIWLKFSKCVCCVLYKRNSTITSSDDAVFTGPYTSHKRQEISFDGRHFVVISSIHNTYTGVMSNPGQLVSWCWKTYPMHPASWNSKLITISVTKPKKWWMETTYFVKT